MRQAFFYSLLTLAAVVAFVQPTTAEARGHHRGHCRGTSFQFNVGAVAVPRNETYIVRRYQHVVPGTIVAVPATTVIAPGCYGPYCPPPAVIYPAPAYVEQVYVQPAPRPVGLSGFSFGLGFFK